MTRTETHELLARAFDAAGQPDSAAAHYAIVERAWRNADPSLQPRYANVRARLAELRGQSPKLGLSRLQPAMRGRSQALERAVRGPVPVVS